MKRTFLKFAAAAAVLAVVSACGGSDDDDDDTPAQPGNIVAVASANPNFTFGTPVATLNTANTITITAGTPPVIATIADTTTTPATITAVDVQASNGVIHVIDKVLIPSGILPPPG